MSKKGKRIEVIQKSETGRNRLFKDKVSGIEMTRIQFVNKIENGIYKDYHVRKIKGKDTPVSNPDDTGSNNLG